MLHAMARSACIEGMFAPGILSADLQVTMSSTIYAQPKEARICRPVMFAHRYHGNICAQLVAPEFLLLFRANSSYVQ